MKRTIEAGREPNGGWHATMPRFPGWVVSGQSRKDALVSAQKLFVLLLNEDVRPKGRILASRSGRV